MSKKPTVKHEYNRGKDRFKIMLKHFSLKKKWLRTELLDTLLGTSTKNRYAKRVDVT